MQRYLLVAIFSINPDIFTHMFKDNYRVVGVMSGTSLDGVDFAFVNLSPNGDGSWSYEFIETATIPYADYWQNKLRDCSQLSESEVKQLEVEYTGYLAGLLNQFVLSLPYAPDLVCSHGHTVWHRPDLGYTLQIGDGQTLADTLGIRVVSDFRSQDVAMGGQGAPLVPIGDRLLFGDYDYCLNLGGFANCSMESGIERLAFDLCPVNIVLNRYANQLGLAYDEGGLLASQGKVNDSLIGQLDQLAFYQMDPPKSLGVEWVNQEMDPILRNFEISVQDMLATLVRHMAGQIGRSIPQGSSVLVTGGGAYNHHLINQIGEQAKVRIELPSDQLIEYKEALIFGLLGVLRFRGDINCLASVTGANRDHSSGSIHHPTID